MRGGITHPQKNVWPGKYVDIVFNSVGLTFVVRRKMCSYTTLRDHFLNGRKKKTHPPFNYERMSSQTHQTNTDTRRRIKGMDYRSYRRQADKLYRQRRKAREEGEGTRLRKFSGQTLAEKLEPEVRQIMVMYRSLGLSLSQIADKMGVSRYTVERALALERLRSL